MMKRMSIDELLSMLKSNGRCKTNQELFTLTEVLADTMRKKKSRAVYLEDVRYRIAIGKQRFIEPSPEADYLTP